MLRFLPINISIRNSTHLLLTNLRSNPLSTVFRFLNQENLYNNNNNNLSSLTTVSYQINSCELSPQISASKKINLKTTEKLDHVLNFFKSHGFTNTQIETIITKYLQFLSFNLEKTTKPKLDYFLDADFSATELARIVSLNPTMLWASLEKKLKPNFELLNSVIGNTQQVAVALRRCSWLLNHNVENDFLPNVRALQSYGVPNSCIAKLVILHLRALMMPAEKFATIIDSVSKLAFNPLSTMFVRGVSVMSQVSPSTWERKVAIYKSLGWSEEDVISAVSKYPHCMATSEEKIKRAMDFFVKKMHWAPSVVSRTPVLLGFSLEKRVIPRFLVLSLLASKGLVKGHPSVGYILVSEKRFLDRYVTKYQGQVPELLEIYKGDLESIGFEGKPSPILGS